MLHATTCTWLLEPHNASTMMPTPVCLHKFTARNEELSDPCGLVQCSVNVPVAGTDYVCLGPGYLCPGGIYVGGYGDSPDCEYPVSLVKITVLVKCDMR